MPDGVFSSAISRQSQERKLQSPCLLVLKMYSIIFVAHLIAVTLANFRQIECRINGIVSQESFSKLRNGSILKCDADSLPWDKGEWRRFSLCSLHGFKGHRAPAFSSFLLHRKQSDHSKHQKMKELSLGFLADGLPLAKLKLPLLEALSVDAPRLKQIV